MIKNFDSNILVFVLQWVVSNQSEQFSFPFSGVFHYVKKLRLRKSKKAQVGERIMVVSNRFMEIKRRAKKDCLESLLDLADCYSQGLYGVEKSDALYLESLLALLDRIDELRESKFSSALVLYEIMYSYLDQRNFVMAEYYHHHLTWELVWDYPSEDLEPHFDQYQIRDIAKCFEKDMEDILDQVKSFQKKFDPKSYTVMDVNHFFTN